MIAPALILLQIGISTGSVPDTVTVGDRFRTAVRVSGPPGTRVMFASSPPSTDAVSFFAGGPTLSTARGTQTAVYTASAWVPGLVAATPVAVRVQMPDGRVRTYPVRLRLPFVRAVLPTDTTGVRPRALKDVWAPPGGPVWLWLLLVAALLAALGALLWWRARRRPGSRTEDAGRMALAALDRLRPEASSAFYAAVSAVLREFAAATSPACSLDLTTAELLAEMRRQRWSPAGAERMEEALSAADAVKFAREVPTVEAAGRMWATARAAVSR